VPVVRRGIDERRLRDVDLARELLQPVLRDVARVGEDRDLVPWSGVSVKTSATT